MTYDLNQKKIVSHFPLKIKNAKMCSSKHFITPIKAMFILTVGVYVFLGRFQQNAFFIASC